MKVVTKKNEKEN